MKKQLKLNFSKSVFGVRGRRSKEMGGLPGFHVLQQRQPIWVVERFSFIAVPQTLLAENVQTYVLKLDSSVDHWADQYKSLGGRGCHLWSPGISEGFLLHVCSRTGHLCGTAHFYLSRWFDKKEQGKADQRKKTKWTVQGIKLKFSNLCEIRTFRNTQCFVKERCGWSSTYVLNLIFTEKYYFPVSNNTTYCECKRFHLCNSKAKAYSSCSFLTQITLLLTYG